VHAVGRIAQAQLIRRIEQPDVVAGSRRAAVW
jgi:hypothetical protein